MGQVDKITKQTDNRFLNMYEFETTRKTGSHGRYYVASRAERTEDLKAVTGIDHPDGVVIYSLYGEKKDKIVLIHQYRYPIAGWVYEFPAGLVERGEDYHEAAVREMKEETGLTLTLIDAPGELERPLYSSVGMTDESNALVFGYSEGEITSKYEEEGEEIEVVLADRAEVRRILKEEPVGLMAGYMMMHFLHDEDPFAFVKE